MTSFEGGATYLALRRARGALAHVAHATLGRLALLPLRATARFARRGPALPAAPSAILVVCPGKLGDTVAAEPAIRLLRARFPAARLEALGRRARGPGPIRGGAEVLALVPGLDAVHAVARARDVKAIAGAFDLVVVLGLRAADAWLGLAARGERGVVLGFDWRDRGAALDVGLAPPDQVMVTARDARARAAVPQHLFWTRLLAAAGLIDARAADAAAPPRLVPKPAHSADACALAREHGLEPDARVVALAPWNEQAHYRWPEARWIALGRALLDDDLATGVAVVGGDGPFERAHADRVAAALGPRAASFVGLTGVDRSAALLAIARLAVAIDSGPAHLARAVGTPVVSIFGPGSPDVWCPPGALAVQRDAGCFGCRQPRCSVSGHECLERLDIAPVLEAARRALAPARA